MTRDEMNAYIRDVGNDRFQSEIRHYMTIDDREGNYDEVCALLDHEQACETFLNESKGTNKSLYAQYRRDLQIARAVLIRLEFYREVTQEEIDNTVSNRKRWWNFEQVGKKFTTEHTVEEWMNI